MNGGPRRDELLSTVRAELGADDDLVCTVVCTVVEVSSVGGTEKLWYAETEGSHRSWPHTHLKVGRSFGTHTVICAYFDENGFPVLAVVCCPLQPQCPPDPVL